MSTCFPSEGEFGVAGAHTPVSAASVATNDSQSLSSPSVPASLMHATTQWAQSSHFEEDTYLVPVTVVEVWGRVGLSDMQSTVAKHTHAGTYKHNTCTLAQVSLCKGTLLSKHLSRAQP